MRNFNTEKHLFIKRSLILTLLVLTCFPYNVLSLLSSTISPEKAEAATQTLSTSADFTAGAFTNTEDYLKEGEVKLAADGTWNARNWRTNDVQPNNGTAIETDGTFTYLLTTRENNFQKYIPDENRWQQLAKSPYSPYAGADIVKLGNYIYAEFGGYQKEFGRYDINLNTWTNLADMPDLVYSGGSLVSDGTNVYALRGNSSTDFWRYNVSANAWTSMASTPAVINSGASLVYDNSTGTAYFYTARGASNAFIRYNITANTWSSMTNIPATISDMGNAAVVGDYIYMVQGNSTTFRRYQITTNAWTTLAATPVTARYVGLVYNSHESKLYIFQGNGSYNWWKYDIGSDSYAGPVDLPAASSSGGNLLSDGGLVYYRRGTNTSTFYSFNPVLNAWTTLTSAPANFSTNDNKGSTASGNLYFYQGANTAFYRYNVGPNTWTTLTGTTPANVSYGASLTYPGSGDYIYGTRGGLTTGFWRYSILGDSWDDAGAADIPAGYLVGYGSRLVSNGQNVYLLTGSGIPSLLKYDIGTNAWSVVGALPFAPYLGTDAVYYNDKIYVQSGNYKKDVWEYTIATASWRQIAPMHGYYAGDIGAYDGASIASDGLGNLYLATGNGLTRMLTLALSAYNYPVSGTWTSAVQDLTYVDSWTSLSATTTTPGDSTITFETRSSTDSASWSSWQSVSGGVIASDANRYLQVKATLTATTDRTQTPTLSDVTINYTGDASDPTNPSTFTGSSQAVGGVSLTSGNSYTYPNPFFSWPAAGVAGGASDAETSIAGYYVYFGTSNSADPESLGSLQTAVNYTVTTPLSNGTYYLRIKTKDAIGNISAASTAFTYTYTGVSPPTNVAASTTSDFSTGTASNVLTINDQLQLATASGGFWLQERLSLATATISNGGNLAYVSSSNKMYTFRGGNTTTFYSYDVATDAWATLAVALGTVNQGGGVIEGPSGFLYGLRGNTTQDFWRYDIEQNSWTAVASIPNVVSYGGSLIYDGSQYIYAMSGNNDDAFFRYDTDSDTWEQLSSTDFGAPTAQVNNFTYVGGDLAFNGADTVYALQGNLRSGFSQYNTATNTWSSLPNLPTIAYYGAQITYDSTTQAIYYVPAYNRPDLYKYSLSDQTWTRLSDAPAILGTNAEGTSLRVVDDHIYALRGGGQQQFYKYDITKNSWLVPAWGLFGREFRGTDYRPFGAGATLIKGDGNNYYMTRGVYDNLFVRYNSSTGAATQMANAPSGFTTGATMTYDSTNNKIYAITSSYVTRLYVYDVATDVWSEVTTDPPPAAPGAGGRLRYDGSRYIYWIRGGSTGFYSYDTQGAETARWSTLSSVGISAFNTGADIVYKSGYIYATRGSNTLSFYRFDVGAGTWSDAAVADLPTAGNFTADGFLTSIGSDGIYGCRGGNSNSCYKYSILGNTWTTITNAPAQINAGGAGASDGSEKIFVIAGTGTNTYSNGLYTYIVQGSTSGFQESGTFTTDTIDLGSVYKIANLAVTYTSASNTSLTVETRSSADNSTWTSWAAAVNQKQVGTAYTYGINSTINRYFQIRFTLASGDGIYSGTLSDYTINYYQDTNKPTNPTDISAYSTSTQSAAITTDNWYNHSAPYFSWPAAEAAGGATDTSSGSGISGYYVYFGTTASSDASTSGTLQTATNYTASSLVSGSTYYLRIQVVDDAGNIASSNWQPFIYKFDNVAPENPTTVTADPSGYTATNSFAFAWSGATDGASGINDYCYKTALGGTENCSVTTASMSGVLAGGTGASTFYIRARDVAGNAPSTYSSVSYYYSATAPSAPQALAVSPTSNTVNQFSFSWDPPSVFYGAQANLRYFYSANALPTAENVNQVGLSDTNLATDAYATVPGDNTMYVVAKDEAGNIDYNNYASVTFTADTSAPGIPKKLDIADISVKTLSAWKLAISWEAPDASGSGVSSYKVYGSTTSGASCTTDFSDFSYLASTTGRSYVDTDITQVYHYYCVKACDSTNNCSAASSTVSKYPTGKYETAAELTASPSATVKTKSAVISWSTSRTSNSFVKYGTSSGDYGDEVGSSTQVTAHTISLDNLAPGTTYYYKISWTDEDGNVGSSDEKTFATNPAPVVSSVKITNISINSVYVNFTVQYATSVKIQYGKTINYGGLEKLSTSTVLSSNTVQLEDLEEGTEYHIQIVAEDEEGNTFAGDDHTFDTLPQPKITALKMQQVAGQPTATLRLLWTSNTLISTIVTYYPTAVPTAAKDRISLVYKKTHDVIITDLIDDTDYTIVVKGKDSVGNEAVYTPQKIKTAVDLRPPEISNMNVETTIVGIGDQAKAQVVASWDTDEPATTQVEYAEGTGTSYSQSTQEDTNKTTNHIVTISGLAPSKIYHLRAVSKDKSNNIGQSFDTVIVTPKSTKDALNLVIDNLAKTFGFLKNISQ